jgi:hypothetical protein
MNDEKPWAPKPFVPTCPLHSERCPRECTYEEKSAIVRGKVIGGCCVAPGCGHANAKPSELCKKHGAMVADEAWLHAMPYRLEEHFICLKMPEVKK